MSVTPVPDGWYTHEPPRSRDELIRDHLAREFDALGSFEAAELVLDVLNRALDRVDELPGEEPIAREVFSAAVLAVLASDAGVLPYHRRPRPATAAPLAPLPCSRPSCVRAQAHDGFHKDRDNEPLCAHQETCSEPGRGPYAGRVCVRAMGHPNGHDYATWYAAS